MIVANHTCDLPRSVPVLPQVNEPSFADSNLLVAGMMKAVHARFNRAVSLHVEGLHADEFSRGFSADVLLHAVGKGVLAQGDATLIVVELNIVHKEGRKLLQVAFVVGVEQCRI